MKERLHPGADFSFRWTVVLLTGFLVLLSGACQVPENGDELKWKVGHYLEGSGRVYSEMVAEGQTYSFNIQDAPYLINLEEHHIAVWSGDLSTFIGFTTSGGLRFTVNSDTALILYSWNIHEGLTKVDQYGGNWIFKKREIKVKRQDWTNVKTAHADAIDRLLWNSGNNPETGGAGVWDQLNAALTQNWPDFPAKLAWFTVVPDGQDLRYGMGDPTGSGQDSGHDATRVWVNYDKLIASFGNQLTDEAFQSISGALIDEICRQLTGTGYLVGWKSSKGIFGGLNRKLLRYCFFKRVRNPNLARQQGYAVVFQADGTYTVAGEGYDIIDTGYGRPVIIPAGRE